MSYLEWNNALGKWFFNNDKSDQEVYLFISRQDVIEIGIENGFGQNKEAVFNNYIDSVRNGLSNNKTENDSILKLALQAYREWKKGPEFIDGIKIERPLYIAYLVLFVLPLTESSTNEFRSDAYYPLLDSFLRRYQLPTLKPQNKSMNWNCLWEDLEEWSILKKNTELGYFELHKFKNKNWIYVGKPLSQSVFPSSVIRKLPHFFELCDLVPGMKIDTPIMRQYLLYQGINFLELNNTAIEAIRDKTNELGQSIVRIIVNKYKVWDGITDQYNLDQLSVKKGNTIVELRLCIEGDKVSGFKFYYRVFTKLDFPEDLCFIHKNQQYFCKQYGKGWSRPLMLPYEDNIEIKDDLNKWTAKFLNKDVRLFVEGVNYHLSGWVEVPFLVNTRMLILAKSEFALSIENWGESFEKNDFIKLNIPMIPNNLILYEIRNPKISHPEISILQLKSNKQLVLKGGLFLGGRKWLNGLLPIVELENGTGTESLYLQYEREKSINYLVKKNSDLPEWILPTDIELNRRFNIKVDGEKVERDQLKNTIIQFEINSNDFDEEMLPSRNKFGEINHNNTNYVKGSNLYTNKNYSPKQIPYKHLFKPKCNYRSLNESSEIIRDDELLLSFLTYKRICKVEDYYVAFEELYFNKFNPENNPVSDTLSLSQLKRWSLNYLDYMGFLDYDYLSRKIVVNKPQLKLIPTDKGRTALLIGGRTANLVIKLKKAAINEGLQLEISQQDQTLKAFNLPPSVFIKGSDKNSGFNIEYKIKKVANNCGIPFYVNEFNQIRLAEFSVDIDSYIEHLKPIDHFDDDGWSAKVFSPQTLCFEPIQRPEIDKDCSLIEYKLSEYNYKHILWFKNEAHEIDKSWGRYIILKYLLKKVIFTDSKNTSKIIAVPSTTPLPRLISEALTLFSGKAPARVFLKLGDIKATFSIYKNVPNIFASNCFRKIGQELIRTDIEL